MFHRSHSPRKKIDERKWRNGLLGHIFFVFFFFLFSISAFFHTHTSNNKSISTGGKKYVDAAFLQPYRISSHNSNQSYKFSHAVWRLCHCNLHSVRERAKWMKIEKFMRIWMEGERVSVMAGGWSRGGTQRCDRKFHVVFVVVVVSMHTYITDTHM